MRVNLPDDVMVVIAKAIAGAPQPDYDRIGAASGEDPAIWMNEAVAALKAVPDGWAKVDGEWVRLVAVGWTYDNSPSGYFCGGPSVALPDQHPKVYAEVEMVKRKEAAQSKVRGREGEVDDGDD